MTNSLFGTFVNGLCWTGLWFLFGMKTNTCMIMPHISSHELHWNSIWTNQISKNVNPELSNCQFPHLNLDVCSQNSREAKGVDWWRWQGGGFSWLAAKTKKKQKKEEQLEEESRHKGQILQNKPHVGLLPQSPAPVWEGDRVDFQNRLCTKLCTKLKYSLALVRRWWWKRI